MEDFFRCFAIWGKKITQKYIYYYISSVIDLRRNYVNINVRNNLGKYITNI